MNIYLIGYRGSGKTTVARLLAAELNRSFADTDQLIEQASAKTITEIFADEGEARFRKLETEMILRLPADEGIIVSLGGGAVLSQVNRDFIDANGKKVWLTAPPEVLWSRINADSENFQQRPNLTDQGGLAEVEQVLAAREPIYAACADFTVDVSDSEPEEIALQIAAWWQTVDKNQK